MKTKITFDTENQLNHIYIFHISEDWELFKRKNTAFTMEKPYLDPEKFPCIAIDAGYRYNPDGLDRRYYAYIYDFTCFETEE